MARNMISKLALSAVFAVAALTGCQNGDALVAPDASRPAGLASSAASSSNGWEVVEDTTSATGGVSLVIGAEGGELSLGKQRLIVPAGAVDAPTTFRMKKGDSRLKVTLTATRSTTNDVGSAGFAKPLTLVFGYGNAASLPGDPADISVVWIKEDGTFEPQPTVVDTEAKTVSGEIEHFSDYAMASN
jgi:hypothetical protein